MNPWIWVVALPTAEWRFQHHGGDQTLLCQNHGPAAWGDQHHCGSFTTWRGCSCRGVERNMPLSAEHSATLLHSDHAAAFRARTASRTAVAAPHRCVLRGLESTCCMELHAVHPQSHLVVWICVQDCSCWHWPAACVIRFCGRSSSSCSTCGTSHCRESSSVVSRSVVSYGMSSSWWSSAPGVLQMHRLQLAANSMQPLTALQQLTALVFTSCEHSTAEEPRNLPVAAIAALSCLEVLETPATERVAATGARWGISKVTCAHAYVDALRWCFTCQDHSQHVVHCAGLQQLSCLRRLEVLQVPCTEPYAITQLAAYLPALRSLDLCCGSGVGPLILAAATSLTELRLRVYTYAFDTVQRMQMPPQLQVLAAGLESCESIFLCAHTQVCHADVWQRQILMTISASFETSIKMHSAAVKALDVTIMFRSMRSATHQTAWWLSWMHSQCRWTWPWYFTSQVYSMMCHLWTSCTAVVAIAYSWYLVCGLQVLASLSLLEQGVEPWQHTAYRPPQTKLRLPEAFPWLRHLHFGSCFDWDAMSVALWPLALLAAQSISEHEGESVASAACAVAWWHAPAAGSLSACMNNRIIRMASMSWAHAGCNAAWEFQVDASICPGVFRFAYTAARSGRQWCIVGIMQVMRGDFMWRSSCGGSSTSWQQQTSCSQICHRVLTQFTAPCVGAWRLPPSGVGTPSGWWGRTLCQR